MGRKRQTNQYDLTGAYGVGYTSNTNNQFLFDLDDFEVIKNYHWNEHILTNGYLSERDLTISIIILWITSNLRVATAAENVYNRGKQKTNTSGIIGVHWLKDRKRWRAQIRKNGISIAKEFDAFEDAVKERLKFELQLFGRFAPQINLFQQYGVKAGNAI